MASPWLLLIASLFGWNTYLEVNLYDFCKAYDKMDTCEVVLHDEIN